MLDTICTDYKASKQLRKLGINFKTYFYWDIETKTIDLDRMPVDHNDKTIIAAYTFEQILHLLPIHIARKDKPHMILSLDIFPFKSLMYSNEYLDRNYSYTIEERAKKGKPNHATLAARLIIQIDKLC